MQSDAEKWLISLAESENWAAMELLDEWKALERIANAAKEYRKWYNDDNTPDDEWEKGLAASWMILESELDALEAGK